MQYTDELRRFWRCESLQQARDERVTVPANPATYTDEAQDAYLSEILRDVPDVAGSIVLDYGCGIGRVTRALLRRRARVFAVDVSPQMLAYCRQYCDGLPGLVTVLCPGDSVPLVGDATVDGAICLYVLQHCPTLEMARAILEDLARVICPGGWLVAQSTDHGQEDTAGRVGFFGERQTRDWFLAAIESAGFSVVSVRLDADQAIVTGAKPC